jgi:hypothetical protein
VLRYLSTTKSYSGIGAGIHLGNPGHHFQKPFAEPIKVSDYSNKERVQVVHPQAAVTTTAPLVTETKANVVDSKIKENRNTQEISDEELFKEAKPDVCNHYVGYINPLRVSMQMPKECYTCTKLIDCAKKDYRTSPCSST